MARKTIPFTCKGCGVIFHRIPRPANRNKYCTNKCQAAHVQIEPLIDRFNRYVRKDASGCWHWTGATDAKGYGSLLIDRQGVRAHRLAYMLFVGDIPDGHLVCHHCDEPSCVNPDHLFTGTNTDNMRDMVLKDRRSHTLTVEQAIAIRNDPRLLREIAAEYNVSFQFICDIKKYRVWKYV
jgi:HNH endonuclease